MTRLTCLRGGVALFGAVLLAALWSREAHAQAATITGRVTNEADAPIVGANVIIQQLNLGTTTGQDGRYTLTIPAERAAGQRVQLNARFIGFSAVTRDVVLSAGSQTQDFKLKADPFRLDEMVVTGVAEATSAKKLTFSVARVDEAALAQVPASSPVAALAGKVSGARVAVGTGNPGASPTIRLRGSTNLTIGGSQPLIILDGVITKNSLADIDANDIASIEVLKGAAAASFYGSDAANGVVNITTKRGRDVADGTTSITVRSEYGQQDLERFVPLNHSHVYEMDGGEIKLVNGNRVVKADGIADNPYPTAGPNHWRNQVEEWMANGESWSTSMQLGVRRGNTNLHSTFTTNRDQGILPMTRGMDRQNFRLNVDQGVTEKLDFSASATYGVTKRDNTSATDGWFALLQAPPDLDLRYPRGTDKPEFHRLLPDWAANGRGNPLYQFANDNYENRRERILGSVVGRYRPADWLRFEASYGTDRSNRRTQNYVFRGYETEGGGPGLGSMSLDHAADVATNSQLNATVTRTLGELSSTTRLAYIYEAERNRSFSSSGNRFIVGGVPDLNALNPDFVSIGSSESDIRTENYAVSQNFDFRDRYLVDAMYRRDGSSLFGSAARWQNFYRISGAWRISEDFEIPGVQDLKLRAARGTAGIRPGYAYQYETYSVSGGSVSKSTLGNRNLTPAIQVEDEFGLNVSFLDRFSLEVVRANRVTEGAFLNVPLASATSGGFLTQWQNAADVEAKTTELMFEVRVLDRPDFSYSFSLTGDHTSQRIRKMNRAPFRVNAGGQNQDVFYYKEGEDLGIIYGVKLVRDPQELLDNPANSNINLGDYIVNPIGYVVKKSAPNTPIAYVDASGQTQRKIGNVNPDFSFGWANNIRWKDFGVYVLVDGVKGGDIYNHTRQWMYQDHRHGDMDMAGRPEDQKVQNAFFASGLYNGNSASSHFVEDGSYARLREVSVNYSLGPRLMHVTGLNRLAKSAKVAFIGRNLMTFTDYSGFDPEVTSGSDFNFRIDGFRYPNFRQISAQVELSF